MITQRAGVTAEALFNTNASLATGEDECVLYREDLEALLEHIEDLEFEVSRLRGTDQHTHPIAALYEAFNQRAE